MACRIDYNIASRKLLKIMIYFLIPYKRINSNIEQKKINFTTNLFMYLHPMPHRILGSTFDEKKTFQGMNKITFLTALSLNSLLLDSRK